MSGYTLGADLEIHVPVRLEGMYDRSRGTSKSGVHIVLSASDFDGINKMENPRIETAMTGYVSLSMYPLILRRMTDLNEKLGVYKIEYHYRWRS
jgi:hypothetical protein